MTTTPMPCIRRAHSRWTVCPCPPCRQDRRRIRKLARSGLITRVPSAAAWDVINDLRRRGWTGAAIASAARLPSRSIDSALHDQQQGRVRTFGPTTSARIVSHGPPTEGMVGAHGARRRLQGIAREGYSLQWVADTTGIGVSTLAAIRLTTTTVSVARHALIIDATAKAGARPGPHQQSAATAARRGWAPMLAWEGIDIDDPDARPDTGQTRRGVHIDDIADLTRTGGTWESVAARTGITPGSIDVACRRAGRLDLIDQLITAAAGRDTPRRTA